MRSPLAATIGFVLATATWFFLARRAQAIATDLETAWHFLERNSSRLIGVIALIAAIVASTFATRSAAGADASGYLSQARMWEGGFPVYFETLALSSPEVDGWVTTPLGWRPHEQFGAIDYEAGVQVPTYPPGLPLLMAAPHAVAGINGAQSVVIASAAIAIWATGMLAGGVAGVVAAVLLAISPVFLHQSFQPMSDVPVTAAWMLTFLLVRGAGPSGPALSGLACALAVLIRPNLAPLAIVPLFLATRKVHFAAPVAVAGVLLGSLQWFWYGSPLRSGYGSAEELFAVANIAPNTLHYINWLMATAPVLFLAPFGFVRVIHDKTSRALGAFAGLVVAAYLIYAVFDHWSYLRFLLPAMAVFAILSAVEIAAAVERWPMSWRAPMVILVMLGLTAHNLFVARELDTFKLADQLRRVQQAADFIGQYSGERPVIVSGEQSGAMRYYTMNSIVRWEAATPETMRAALTAIERSGHSTYIALDAWEQELFLKKFASIPELQLDWPPMLEAGSSHRTKVWRVSDRERFLAGTQLQTVRLP